MWDLFQACRDATIFAINKCDASHKQMKDKNHLIRSIDAEMQHPAMIKNSAKTHQNGNRVSIPQYIKAIYKKPIATSYSIGKNKKHFPLDQEQHMDVCFHHSDST